MGPRIQARRDDIERRALARLTFSYLAIFGSIAAVLSVIAYAFVESNYRSIVLPALDTPEGRAGLAAAMRPALFAILSGDVLLLLFVGLVSFALARAALRPLALAREREERFSADIAHELRTPIAAIAAIAQAASSGTPAEAQAGLASVSRRALECGQLVADLLTLARSSDADALEVEPVDLAVITEGVCRDVVATDDGLVVERWLQSAIVEGDERRLRQLVRNLLDNARNHAVTRIDVRVAAADGSAQLTVSDDGAGVAPSFVPLMFERFSKGEGSRGSGLGLAIGRWVARAHGGDLSFAGGSRFVARIPLARFDRV